MVKRIYVPTTRPRDWQPLLAQPQVHWKAGHSSMALAQCWEAASPGMPEEVARAFDASGVKALQDVELVLAIPGFDVPLAGGDHPSQTGLLVVARGSMGLVTVAVEGKVNEPFGPTLGEKRSDTTIGITERLAYLHDVLELSRPAFDTIRYQLLHHAASAVLVAEQFGATATVMLVHSFSPEHAWVGDYEVFARLLGATPVLGSLSRTDLKSVDLYLGWCEGETRFLEETVV